MRPLSLGKILIGVNVGLVVLAVLGVVAGGLAHLQRLASEQAVTQVRFAGSAAQEALNRSRDDARVSARILAERPTLARLLGSGDAASLQAFLEPFRTTSQMTACAVWRGGVLVASAAPAGFEWDALATTPDDWGFLPTAAGAPLTLIAVAPVTAIGGARVAVALRLDEVAAAALGREVGVQVAILGRAAALAVGTPDRQAQRAEAMESGEIRAAPFAEEESFVASLPLRSPAGQVVGVVETDLPMAGITDSLSALGRSLWAAALLVALLAGVLGIVLARWLSRPLQALTVASARIGQGDLTTPIPRAGGAEAALLATAMEEMRRRLLQLTGDLRRQQNEAEAVLGGIGEGVFAVDRDRRVRYLNPQAAALLGVQADQAIGRFCGDLLDPVPVDGERPCETHCPILDARFRGSARATEHLRAGGRLRTVVVASAPPPESAGTPRGGEPERQFQVLRDETEIEGARRARDAVLANISHEFRTPLAAQIASLELLRDRLPETGADAARQLVQSLERGALRLTQLIDNLLESVRIEAGELSIRRAQVALDEVAEAAVEITAPLLAQREQRASLDLPYPLPEISGDAARLTQVLVNLLANSSKFAPPASEIRIGGEVGADTVTLWVDDDGPGLPPGAAERVFERFVREPGQAENGEPAASGVGLGLWIVRSIVERHGGRVDAAAASGGGMRVRLVLPHAGAAAGAAGGARA